MTPRNQINDQKVPGKISKNHFSMNSIKLSEVISPKPQVREESDIGNKRVAKLTKKLSATKKRKEASPYSQVTVSKGRVVADVQEV